MSQVAVIQKAPVVLNRDATIARAIKIVDQVASRGAELIVFTEAHSRLPGVDTAPAPR